MNKLVLKKNVEFGFKNKNFYFPEKFKQQLFTLEEKENERILERFAGKDAMKVLTLGLILVGLMSSKFSQRKKRASQIETKNVDGSHLNLFYKVRKTKLR